MNAQRRVPFVKLTDDGELSTAIACTHCGHVHESVSERCERCGVHFPAEPTLLRLQLESLRRSDAKKNEVVRSTFGLSTLGYLTLIVLTVIFTIVLLVYLISRAVTLQ